MSQNQTPETPTEQPVVDAAARAAAAQALLQELHLKTQKVLTENPELLKPAPDKAGLR